MQSYWLEWFTLVGVFSVAVMSPGPDFVVAVRNALAYGRRAGLWTALGFGCGVAAHATYTLLGIAALIAQSIVLFNVLKYAGAAYLIYMGFKAIRSRGSAGDLAIEPAQSGLDGVAAFRSGFITNLLNPKASLFFLALFTQIVDPHTPIAIQTLFGLTCAVMVTVWFSLVACILSAPGIRARFLRAAQWIDRICGGIFIALGLKLALTRAPV